VSLSPSERGTTGEICVFVFIAQGRTASGFGTLESQVLHGRE
jgi:hypothetical protein